jgi:hypothetical protein
MRLQVSVQIPPYGKRLTAIKRQTLTWFEDHELMSNDSVDLTLTKPEALVLFELLADFHEQNELTIRNQAERIALWNLSSRLEKTLVEVFSPDYDQLVVQARDLVVSNRP